MRASIRKCTGRPVHGYVSRAAHPPTMPGSTALGARLSPTPMAGRVFVSNFKTQTGTNSVCCGNFSDHVTIMGVSRRVTDILLHHGGKDSQQTL